MMRSNFAYVVPKLCQVHSNNTDEDISCLHQDTNQKLPV